MGAPKYFSISIETAQDLLDALYLIKEFDNLDFERINVHHDVKRLTFSHDVSTQEDLEEIITFSKFLDA